MKQSLEHVNRMEGLKVQQANAEYERMTRSVRPATEGTWQSEAQETRAQLTVIFNILFSIVGVFIAVYWIAHSWTDDVALRVLLALMGALLVGVAEVWLYLSYSATGSK